MDFATLPPEINSGRMYAGPGPGPMLAAAAAWDGLAAELQAAGASHGSVISGLTAGPWLGPASAAMAAAAGPYVAWMRTTATQAEQAATQAKAAAAAYEVAFAATVPPSVIAANRALLATLIATNIFGQNTPAIAATETDYAEMWAQDAATMYGYAGVSATATTLTPFTPPPQSINPGGLGGQAAALAQATATSTATKTQTVLSQLTSAVPTALQGLASPLSSTSAAAPSTSGLLALLQSLGLISPSTILEPTDVGIASSELTTASGAWASASQGDAEILQNNVDAANEISDEQGLLTARISGMEDRIMSRLGQFGAGVSAPSAGLSQAASVGALSVPPAWTAAAPAIRLAAVTLPTTTLSAAPEVFAGNPGSLFSQMALAGMAGRAISGPANPRQRERIGATTRACQAPPPRPPASSTADIAGEIREFADLLGKLGALRDSGLLTEEEFSEQKQRLLGR